MGANMGNRFETGDCEMGGFAMANPSMVSLEVAKALCGRLQTSSTV